MADDNAQDSPAPSKGLMIPVTKGGGFVEIDTATIPQEVYEAALAEGLKAFVNKGMSKIMTKGLEGQKLAEAQAAAMKKGQENAEAIKNGTIKLPGRKAKGKTPGKVMTEAMRLARNLIKDAMKAQGIKISHVKASEITKAAKAYLEQDQSLIAKAEANLAEREAAPAPAIDIKSLIHEDPALVAKAEAAAAKKKEQLSAKQAGLPAKRKGKAPATQPQA